jgi:hypothetical protein
VAIEHNPLVVIYGHRRTRRARDLAEPPREGGSGQPNPAAGLE